MKYNMELDLKNIKRLLKILKHRFLKSKYRILMTYVSYCYAFITYIAIIYNFSYKVHIAAKPIGDIILIIDTLIYLIVYMVINHIVINRIIPKKTLCIIEFILFITLCVLWWSDLMLENRHTEPFSGRILLPSFIS